MTYLLLQKMNLILYDKNKLDQNGLAEFLQNNPTINVITASSRHEVLKHFNSSINIDKVIFWNMSLPSDLGLIKYIKENFAETKIMVFASPIIKQSIEIIKATEIEVMNNTFEELKKINYSTANN
jgi:DNA-binding NarL/FixJ family response regulator